MAIHPSTENLISIRDGKLYSGIEPDPEYKYQYVDYINGNDSNAGTKDSPLKTIDKALSRINTNTRGTYIYLKEGQTHYFSEGVGSCYKLIRFDLQIHPYGDNHTRMRGDWSNNGLNPEYLEACEEFNPYRPTIVFKDALEEIPNEILPDGRKALRTENFIVSSGFTLSLVGMNLKRVTSDRSAKSFWFNSIAIGAGNVRFTACKLDTSGLTNGNTSLLANSTVGPINVIVQYLQPSDAEYYFGTGQYIGTIQMSYVTGRRVENRAKRPMYYNATETYEGFKSKIHNLTQYNPITSF